jgi:hypothetical protein
MILSYTGMAAAYRPRGLAGVSVPTFSTSKQADAWVSALPPQIKREFESQVRSIALSLPITAQMELARTIIGQGHILSIPLALDGIGCACDSSVKGLGFVGPLIMGLAQLGGQIYTGKEANKNSAALAAAAERTQLAIAQAQIAAQQKSSEAAIEAQSRANTLVLGLRSKQTYIFGGIAALAVVAGLGIYFIKRKKSRG